MRCIAGVLLKKSPLSFVFISKIDFAGVVWRAVEVLSVPVNSLIGTRKFPSFSFLAELTLEENGAPTSKDGLQGDL